MRLFYEETRGGQYDGKETWRKHSKRQIQWHTCAACITRKKTGSVQLLNAVHLFWTNESQSVRISINLFETLTKSYLVNLNPNLLDLGSISWNSVESVSFQIFLLGLELLHRLPHKWWDLDDLPCGRATLGEQLK